MYHVIVAYICVCSSWYSRGDNDHAWPLKQINSTHFKQIITRKQTSKLSWTDKYYRARVISRQVCKQCEYSSPRGHFHALVAGKSCFTIFPFRARGVNFFRCVCLLGFRHSRFVILRLPRKLPILIYLFFCVFFPPAAAAAFRAAHLCHCACGCN